MTVLCKAKDPFPIALNIAESWLLSRGEQPTLTENSITIRGKTFVLGEDIDPRALASLDPDTALAAFWQITEAVGLGRPQMMRPGLVLDSSDLGISLRLREYVHAPNLPKEIEDRLMKECGAFILRMYRQYRTVLAKHGVEREDLLMYSRIWLTSFYHRYRRPTFGETCRLATHYIRQRVEESVKPRPMAYHDKEESVGLVIEDMENMVDMEPSAEVRLADHLAQLSEAEYKTLLTKVTPTARNILNQYR